MNQNILSYEFGSYKAMPTILICTTIVFILRYLWSSILRKDLSVGTIRALVIMGWCLTVFVGIDDVVGSKGALVIFLFIAIPTFSHIPIRSMFLIGFAALFVSLLGQGSTVIAHNFSVATFAVAFALEILISERIYSTND